MSRGGIVTFWCGPWNLTSQDLLFFFFNLFGIITNVCRKNGWNIMIDSPAWGWVMWMVGYELGTALLPDFFCVDSGSKRCHQCKMATLGIRIFWLYLCQIGGSRDMSFIFIYVSVLLVAWLLNECWTPVPFAMLLMLFSAISPLNSVELFCLESFELITYMHIWQSEVGLLQ